MGLTLEDSPVESPSVATGPKRAFGIREGWLDSFICLKIWIARMTYSQTETLSNEQFY
mgnify:FL=1